MADHNKFSTVTVPRVLVDYLDKCNERDASCERIEMIAWVCGILLLFTIVVAYYYVKATGGIQKIDISSLKTGFDAAPQVVTPVQDRPTYGQGNTTSDASHGCYQRASPADDVKFSNSELLDVAIINQKISEYETTYADQFTPNESAYNHERFMVDDSLGSDVSDSHKKWAEEAKRGTLSMTALVQPFDPEEALTANGVRQARKNAKANGVLASAMSLYDPNDQDM